MLCSHVGYTASFFRLRFGGKTLSQIRCLLADQYDHVNIKVLAELCFARAGVMCVAHLPQDDTAFYINILACGWH